MKRKTPSDFTLLKRILKKRKMKHGIEYRKIILVERRYEIHILFTDKGVLYDWETVPV